LSNSFILLKNNIYRLSIGFLITRSPENGGNIVYFTYEELEAAFVRSELHPGDLKDAVAVRLNELLDIVRKYFEQPEMKNLTAAAYPSPAKATKAAPAAATAASDDVVAPHRLDTHRKNCRCSKAPECWFSLCLENRLG
jgi:hypothetical protein